MPLPAVRPPNARALGRAFAASLLALLVWRFGGNVLWPPGGVALALLALAVASPVRDWPWAIATVRLAVALLAIHAWHGIGWWALAVATPVVAWRDARNAVSPSRPLLPVVVALLAVVAWSGYRPGENIWRSIAVAVVSAFAVALATRSAAQQPADAG